MNPASQAQRSMWGCRWREGLACAHLAAGPGIDEAESWAIGEVCGVVRGARCGRVVHIKVRASVLHVHAFARCTFMAKKVERL